MATKIRASIKLAPGQVGFYDERTGLHLTLAKTTEDVYENMNIYGIKQAVRQGRVIVTSGSLEDEAEEKTPAPVEIKKAAKKTIEKPVQPEVVEPVVQEEPVKEAVAEEPIVAEEVVEEVKVVEEAVATEKPKKKTNKKASKKED